MWLSHLTLTLTSENHGPHIHEKHAVWCPSRITLKTHYPWSLESQTNKLKIGIEHKQIEGSKQKKQASKFTEFTQLFDLS